MRELIISKIKEDGWLDYSFVSGDGQDAPPEDTSSKTYSSWLIKLSDEELLAAFVRVHDAESLANWSPSRYVVQRRNPA